MYGKILKVSDTKQGFICKEFVYTMQARDDGQIDEVYESAIDHFYR